MCLQNCIGSGRAGLEPTVNHYTTIDKGDVDSFLPHSSGKKQVLLKTVFLEASFPQSS